MIHQFNPTIYPYLLWVTKDESIEDINTRFEGDNGGCFTTESLIGDAFTATVVRKCDKRRGVLVVLTEKSELPSVAHEAVHVASQIFSGIGTDMDVDNSEPFAYLTDFAFDCINQVFTNKFKEE